MLMQYGRLSLLGFSSLIMLRLLHHSRLSLLLLQI
jgi:hypothetical protein